MLRRVVQRAGIALVCFASLFASPSTSYQAAASADGLIASNYPEVRLRKLHLVRPDLIPYPIAYEVIC